MELAPGLFVGGLVIFACLYLWLRQRGTLSPAGEATAPPDLALAASSDAVLIGSEHGELIYINEPARRWLTLDDTQLDLERVAQQAEPSDSLLSLFAGETRTAFELAGRWVEGTSHRLSTGGETRTVVVLRDLSAGAAGSPSGSLDLSRAIDVISEIGQTINAGLGVEQVLQALLTIIRKSIPADAGELCLWDDSAQLLEPRGWVGDVGYVLALSERGGIYRPGQGISGWIEQYRKPVFVADRNDPQAVQPLLADSIYQSFIAVPLEIGERFIGTLELASVATFGFTQADFALLQAVGQPVATAVYNAELYADQSRRVDEIANLQQVSAQPGGGNDVSQIYASLTERIARLMDADMTGVFIYDERKQALLAEPPFFGLPLTLARNYSLPILRDTPAEDVFLYRDFWQSNDLADEPLTADLNLSTLVNAAGLTNAMLMPMRVGDERIGMLFVGNKRTLGGFTPNDIRNLRIFAAQATVVVENIRLYQTEQQVNSELAGLQEITQAIGALSHEQEFYSDINARIARLMDIAICGVLLYDETSNRLVSQPPFYGVDDALVSTYAIDLKPGTALAQIWADEEYWYSNRVPTDPIVYEAGFAEASAAMGVTHTILALLSAGGRKLGVVQAANKLDGDDFTDRDARLLLIFATQAAAMIENARLYREVQRRADQAESVRRLSELAGAVLTDTDTLTPMLSEIASLTESPVVFINAYVPERSALVLEPRAVYGAELASPLVQDTGALPSDANAAISRRSFITVNLRADARALGYRLILRDLPINAAAVVPLAVGDRVLGEMVVANRSLPPYGGDDLRLLATIAVQVSSALERIRLHEATGQNLSRRLQELDSISRVSSELNQTLELDRVLAIIRGEALRGTDATGSTIALFAPRVSDAEPVVEQRVGDVGDPALAPIEREALKSLDQPVLVSDYSASSLQPSPASARSAIAMSIVHGDQAVGVLHVYADSAEQFDSQAATFVVTLAAKAALGYANALRYTENLERSTSLRRRVDQLNQIFELGQMLQSSTDPITTLEAIAYSVQQSAGFEVIVIALLEDGVYRRVAQAGIPLAKFEASRALTAAPDKLTSVFADEYRISESYFLPSEQRSQWDTPDVAIFDTGFDGKRSAHPHGPDDWHEGDLLLVPLLASTGASLGVMALDRPFEGHRPNAESLEILEIFAHQAAATLENLRLYQSTIRRTERLSLLNRVSVALAQSLDVQNILNVALTEIAAMTRVESARALVLEREEAFARVVVEYPSRDQAPVDVLAFDASPLLGQVSRSVQPILIPDVAAMPDDDPLKLELQRRDLTAFLAIPIAVSGRAIGLFELEVTDGPREFESEQIDLSAIIANQAAIAMQNANLLEQTLVRTRDLETLLEAAQATSFTLDLGDVFQNVAQLMLQALDMDDCAIMLYFPVENELEVQIDVSRTEPSDSADAARTRLPLSNYPLRARALEERQVLIVQRGDPDGDKRELADLSRARSTARMLVPLVVRDQSIGLIVVDLRSQFRAFSHRDSRMAQALSAQAATAIENARLSTETAARVEELLVINDLSRAISSTMDVDAMIRIVRDQVPNLTEAEQVYLALYEPEKSQISFPMSITDGVDDPHPPRSMGEDEVSFVIRHRRLLSLGGDFSLDELRRNLGIATAEPNAQAYLAVPLISSDQVLGVLAVANLRDKRVFGLNDQRILTTIGTQIAVALQNARLFNRITTFADDLNKRVEERTLELADERDRLDTLYRITSELARTLDTDRVLTGALEMVVGAVGADEGVIFLIDPSSDQLFNRASFLQNESLGKPHAAEALGAYLMQTGQQVLIGDLPEEEFWRAEDDEARQWNSAIGVILESNGMSQGAMVFLSKKSHAFTQPQMRLVAASANQVATALNNADLYNLIREQAERLGGMLRSEQEEAEKSAAILESIADGVMLADARGKVILFNSAAVRIVGLSRQTIMGQPVSKLASRFSGASRDWIYAISEWASNPQDRKLNELSTTRLELGDRILNVQISRVYATEQLIGTVAVFRDVTRDVEVDRMKSEFVSNVSHELRTPMTSIKGYADLLLVGAAGTMTEQQQQFITTIKTNADRLASLVNDLLNISKIDAGTERMKLEDVDIDLLVSSVASGLRTRSEHDQKVMTVNVELDPALPQIRGDREKLSQVLMNVADNAFNYTYAGGTITLRAGLRPGFDQVLISVTDTGIGIPAEFQPRVWGRFERYDEHALVMEVAGTGLGLSIARTLVEMHRGEIWFESEVNKGTTFYVSLPIHQVDHDTIRVTDMDREQTAL